MRAICICFFLCFLSKTGFSQNERFKSLFIFNFTKNIEWPPDYREGDFIITVLGNSAMYYELQQNVKGKKVDDQTIQVTQAANISGIKKCHVLFIPAPQSNLLEAAIKQLTGTSTLVVTERNGLIRQGTDINIIQVGGKLQFEINPLQIENKNMKISQPLIRLGMVYNPDKTRRKLELESVDDISRPD